VIIAGDMTCAGDRGLRIAQEIRHYAANGLKVGLWQAAPPQARLRISPEIQCCVRRGLASIVPRSDAPDTELLVIHAPSEVAWSERPLAEVRARQTTLVCHRAQDFAVKRLEQRLRRSAKLVWAPTNPWVREAAPPALSLAREDWLPKLDSHERMTRQRSAEAATTIGWIAATGSVPPPPASGTNIIVLDLEREPGFSLDRIDRLDGLCYFPASGETELPDTLIRTALELGMAVALSGWLEPHYGPAARYCQPEEVADALAAPRRDKPALPRNRRQPHRNQAPSPAEQRPVMFLASNGVGIGHLNRLLSIARRMDQRFPILFATQAQAVGAVERLGYLVEYMPSASYVGGNFEVWDEWFRHELDKLLDAYDPALVVYDGNNPSHGLVSAITPRRDCRLAWVRRGLWGNLNSAFIDNSRWFDLIIEPGELEGQPDEGVTAQRQDEAMTVTPIRLLDEKELLPRGPAAKALGLDPTRPAALIQLGAGNNRDVVSLLDHLVTALRHVPQLQICVAEWANSAQSLNYWPDVTILRGYPLSQYFRAFDFSVAAAGYNTFHEVMTFNLPTIFIPNRHPSMDDQAGRAAHAQALQAAFELDEADLDDLPDLITLLMDAKARAFLVDNSQRLHRPNGAADAAHALTALLEAAP
jgi:UDP:flavonoid glycosyltransferase YjiC (YdhE family)